MQENRTPMERPDAPVGLKQIAQEAGLSIMTVSRALRPNSEIAAETRERVLEIARRLRYRPNLLVRAIQTGRSRNVGVVIPPYGKFGSRLVCGIHDELCSEQYLPLLHWKHGAASPGRQSAEEAELSVINCLIDRRVDGVILFPADDSVPDLYFREVWERHIPLVTIDRQLRFTHADFAGTDDKHGTILAVKHLLDLGHTHLAHIAGDKRVVTYADRCAAFEMTLSGAGMKFKTMVVTDTDHDGIAAAARNILERQPRPSAIFLGSDLYAPFVYKVAAALDLNIPSDVSVVGFADLEHAAFMQPPLTTVRQDPYAIGSQAARIVLDRCNGKLTGPEPVEFRLKPELVVRGSTAPPANKT